MTVVLADSSDAVVMRELQDGARVALGVLYDRLAPRAYRTAFSVCHDRDCAQEAVQCRHDWRWCA